MKKKEWEKNTKSKKNINSVSFIFLRLFLFIPMEKLDKII